MGKRDYRWRESKKTKKGAKKIVSVEEILSPPPPVEVIKKGKKETVEE
jgi:hypothetical protein